MRLVNLRLSLAASAVLIVLACGGGGSDAASAIPIGGTINTADFLISAGETRVLNADLTVRATKSIKIDGTLQVPPGYKFALLSDGPCTIVGNIAAVPGPPSGRGDGNSGGDVDGTNVTISGTITLPGSSGFNATASGPNGKLIISGQITAGNGTDGTQAASGGNGGSVQIGTAAAIQHAHDIGRTNDVAFQEVDITATAVITAGNGGKGYDDPVGVDQGTTLFGTGNAGGDGGSIAIASPGPLKNNGTLNAGDGGVGGGNASGFPKGKNGDSHLEKGQNVSITTGVGGGGGSCTLSGSPVSGGGKKFRGLGAYTGLVSATSGDGGDAAPGGDINITLGYKGPDGQGDPVTRTMAKPSVILSGGFGGDGLYPGEVGGAGSKAVITQLGGGVPVIADLAAVTFGIGGIGASGCIEAPFSAGAKGGKAFAIDASGSPVVPRLTNALRGGPGGSGSPPGSGGTGPAGVGPDGSPCTETELVVVLSKPLGKFKLGESVRVDWFEHAHVSSPELPVTEDHGCSSYHLHGNPGEEVFIVDKSVEPNVRYGPFADPFMTFCGFGRIRVRIKPPFGSFESFTSSTSGTACCGSDK